MPIIAVSIAFVASISIGTADQPAGSPDRAQLVVAEGAVSSDGLAVTNGNVIVKTGRPGVAFAFVTKPGQGKAFVYFLIFNHDFPKTDVKTQSSSDGVRAKTHHTINAFGHNCKVEYRITLEPGTETVKAETTVLAGVQYDTSKGRVFLVDMKATAPKVTQVNATLPSKLPALNSTNAAATFAEQTLKKLREADAAVNAFCRRAETGT